MNASILTSLLLFLSTDADKLAEDAINLLKKQAEALKAVKDKGTAQAALPKLKTLGDDWAKIEKAVAKLKPKALAVARAEVRQQLDRVEALPAALPVLRDLPLVKRHVVVKEFAARINTATLSTVIKTYNLIHGAWPREINDLAKKQPDGGEPLVAPDKLKDPWGNRYQFTIKDDVVEVFTTSPSGVRISSLDKAKK